MQMLFTNWLSVIFWAAAMVVLIVIEASTANLVTIWFAVGAMASLITSLFTDRLMTQCLVFAVVSALALILSKPFMDRIRHRKPAAPVGLDRNIGRRAVVLSDILPGEHGRVRLDGVDWLAVCDTPLHEGEGCIVCDVQSTTLKVGPLPTEGA